MLLRPRLQPQLLELLLLLLLLLVMVMLVMVTAHLRNVLSAAVYLPSRRHAKVSYRALQYTPPLTASAPAPTRITATSRYLAVGSVIINVHVYSQRLQKYTKSSRTQNVGLKSHAYTKHQS